MTFGNPTYDVAIVGGGITGTALLYVLASYTNIAKIALIEKYASFAEVLSHPKQNSQTLHFGDIETNYTKAQAQSVQEAAEMIVRYANAREDAASFLFSYPKMVLGVGDREVALLHRRYEEIKDTFPTLVMLDQEGIARVEPKIVAGRTPSVALAALYQRDGYAVDFKALSESFVRLAQKERARVDIMRHTEVTAIRKVNSDYFLNIKGTQSVKARAVVVSAGAYSLRFARALGYGKEYAVLPVAGSFFAAPPYLQSKVYTVQIERFPFAAVHGDPDLAAPSANRFGPTGKVVPFLERERYGTMRDLFKVLPLRWKTAITLCRLLKDRDVRRYIMRNALYELPVVGRFFFIHEVRKIVPTARARDLVYAKGGIRPQLIDFVTGRLVMGERKIVGHHIIFNLTPSPGASVCLKEAGRDAQTIVAFLGDGASFEEERFAKDLTRQL